MLLGIEDDLSVRPQVLCKICFCRIEHYEVTVKGTNERGQEKKERDQIKKTQ